MARLEGEISNPEKQSEKSYEELASLKAEKIRIENREREIDPIISNMKLTVSDLLNVIEVWTGIPASELSATELGELNGLHERISSRIIGQDEAVTSVVRAIRRKRAGISYRTNPVSMIFAGPTGVGKTELVKVLAEDLFKQPESLIRLDMSEFM
jgi:ATP-dependent Clp protease ATP-binding subunit ClpA